MAGTAVESYTQLGNLEDLKKLITNISPEDTVFMSRIGKSDATGRTHDWMTETLQDVNESNYEVEGSTAAFASTDWTARSRVTNYTQILRREFSTTRTQDVVLKAGISGTEFEHQRMLKTKELARDMNWHLINMTSASGASGTARQLNGALAAIVTNTASANSQALQESTFNGLLQDIWNQGGRPNAVYCHGFNKRTISSWSTPLTRNIDANGKKRTVAVDVYDSDFGKLEIYLERHMPTSKVMIIEEGRWKVAFLRPLEFEKMGNVGGQDRGIVESEITLEYLAEKSSGQITGTATA